ncbi:MAG: hypothetical protein GC129_01880 [Proteobacteria bacterium]|nr:hypothetical protein [Pseudomonadota bacterium]
MSEQGQATLAWMSVSKPFEPEAVDFLMAESEEELEARSKEFVWRTAAQLVAQVLCPWWELNMDGAKTDMMTVKNLVQEVLRMREVVPWARLHYSIEPDELDKEAGGVRQPSDPLRLYLFDGSFIRLTEKGPQQPGREKEADAELLMVRSTEHDLRKMEVTTPIQ